MFVSKIFILGNAYLMLWVIYISRLSKSLAFVRDFCFILSQSSLRFCDYVNNLLRWFHLILRIYFVCLL